MAVTISCQRCGTGFRYRSGESGRKFCSADCYRKHRAENRLRPCDQCGARAASKAALARHIEITHTNPRPSVLSLLRCAQCNGPMNSYQRRFCSPECRKAGSSKRGARNPNWKGGKVTVTCETCGAQFEVKPVHGPVARFCSWKCVAPGRRKGSAGFRPDLGLYVRSRWEANYARILNYKEKQGEIRAWTYEEHTFPLKGIAGLRSYTPDFRVWLRNGEAEFHEIKGREDARSLKRRKAFGEQYPSEKLIWINRSEYRDLESKYKWLSGWEQSGITRVAQSPLTAMRQVGRTNGIALFQVGKDGEVWIVMRPERFVEAAEQHGFLADWQALMGDGPEENGGAK